MGLPDPITLDALLAVLRKHGVRSFAAGDISLEIDAAAAAAKPPKADDLPRPVGQQDGRLEGQAPTPESQAEEFEAWVKGAQS